MSVCIMLSQNKKEDAYKQDITKNPYKIW
jgi:hypothetical protein